jgi:uncharacterized protein (DUF305 family)
MPTPSTPEERYLKEHDAKNEQFLDEMIAMNKAALDMNKVALDMNRAMELQRKGLEAQTAFQNALLQVLSRALEQEK